MRSVYRGRKSRVKKSVLAFAGLIAALFLVSCLAATNPLWFKGLVGESVGAYRAEPTEQVLRTDGETAILLCDFVQILTMNSVELETFHGSAEAVKYYRDEILNDMLRDHYSLYTGNGAVLSVLDGSYAHGGVSTWIPAEAFENTVSRYFGEHTVQHKSGNVFEYLRQADGYTAPVQALESQVQMEVTSLEETANTYRMTFVLSDGAGSTAAYSALFVKRSDGSCYLYALDR